MPVLRSGRLRKPVCKLFWVLGWRHPAWGWFLIGSRTLNSTPFCRAHAALRYSERIPFPSTCLRSGGHSEALGRGSGSRAGARRGGRTSPGAGSEEGRPTWTTGRGGRAGAAGGRANQRGPRWARPLPARAPAGSAPHC